MWGGMPGGCREGLCWHCLINLASRDSDFLSNPAEFFKFEKKKCLRYELEQGHGMEPAAPFNVSKCRGLL